MSACGGSLQPRGHDSHPAGGLLLRVREEPGEWDCAVLSVRRSAGAVLTAAFFFQLIGIYDLKGRGSTVSCCICHNIQVEFHL